MDFEVCLLSVFKKIIFYYPCGEIPSRQAPPGGAQHVLDVGGGKPTKHRKNKQTPPTVKPWPFLLRDELTTAPPDLIESILPSTREMFPVPLAVIQLQNRSTPMQNSWTDVLFMKFCALCSQTYICSLWPKSSILTSSVHKTCFQNASGLGLSKYSFATFRC